jgi:hypothetical protein
LIRVEVVDLAAVYRIVHEDLRGRKHESVELRKKKPHKFAAGIVSGVDNRPRCLPDHVEFAERRL